MSGEAGATIEGELYRLFLGSGRMVSVAIPPPELGGDNGYVGRYFAQASAPYQRWLARAQPLLDALFAALVSEGLPLAREGTRAYESCHDQLEHRSVNLSFNASAPVDKAQARAIILRVVAVLERTKDDPPEPEPEPEPEPPPRRMPWWRRLFSG
jgi:hypothetical protein